MVPPDRIFDARSGIVVPGGVVSIDPYRKKMFFWIKTVLFAMFDSYAATA